jgi:hypothetical protein
VYCLRWLRRLIRPGRGILLLSLIIASVIVVCSKTIAETKLSSSPTPSASATPKPEGHQYEGTLDRASIIVLLEYFSNGTIRGYFYPRDKKEDKSLYMSTQDDQGGLHMRIVRGKNSGATVELKKRFTEGTFERSTRVRGGSGGNRGEPGGTAALLVRETLLCGESRKNRQEPHAGSNRGAAPFP